MPALRTEVTEIVTGLAMLGHRDLAWALEVRPPHIHNVTDEHYGRLAAAYRSGELAAEFATAWENGTVFARAAEGLRGRPPWSVEWKGPHKPPGYEQIPADLRIDHVYLVSCKYGSSILHNSGPFHLFDRRLAQKRVERGADWYLEVAPDAYNDLYRAYRDELGLSQLPEEVADLGPADRAALKQAGSRGRWPGAAAAAYREFVTEVAAASAGRWRANLGTARRREEMLWRLLRLQAAPYFVLGATPGGSPTRYRVETPWDFRNRYVLRRFDVTTEDSGQPVVRWQAEVADRSSGAVATVTGHVEVRWSHGRFAQPPEAKVYLDSHPARVPGYQTLEDPGTGSLPLAMG